MNLNERLEALAKAECSKKYYEIVQKFIDEMKAEFNISTSGHNNDAPLALLRDIRYGKSQEIINALLPNYIDDYTRTFIKKVQDTAAILEELEDHTHD